MERKHDYQPYPVGTVFNPLKNHIASENPDPVFDEITISYPSRLNAMALDPSGIASNDHMVYTPGEILFSINLQKNVHVAVSKDETKCSAHDRSPLIMHAFHLMKQAIGFSQSLEIRVDDATQHIHCGLGSSSGLISAVASAINELYGNPIQKQDLITYLAQNHGEEIDNCQTHLMPVQCIGGSAAAGIHGGGLIMICGQSSVVKTMNVSPAYKAVIGIPADYIPIDAKAAMEKELANMSGFVKCGKRYGAKIAYDWLHKGIPAMQQQDMATIGDLIFDYRFTKGSIQNCACMYSRLPRLADELAFIKKEGLADVLSISSVGPSFFAITKEPRCVQAAFESKGLNCITTDIVNSGYTVTKRIATSRFWNDQHQVELFSTKQPDPFVREQLIAISTNPQKKSSRCAIDIGCGAGRNTSLLVEHGFDTYALEPHDAMREACMTRLKKQDTAFDTSHIVRGTMDAIPFSKNQFDVALSIGVLHQAQSISQYEVAIADMARIVKPGGTCITTVFTDAVRDSTFKPLSSDEKTIITKEGLYMTLLNESEFIEHMNHFGLELASTPRLDIKSLETGPRAILRAAFVKR